MRNEALGKPDIARRETEIVSYLRAKGAQGAPAGEIYQMVSDELKDTVSRTAYYKILDRMAAVEKIEASEGEGVRRYSVAEQLSSANRLTLDDVRELLPFENSSETVARAIEAQQYFLERRLQAVRDAAHALSGEHAPTLVFRWLDSLLGALRRDLEVFAHREGEVLALKDDEHLNHRIEAQVRTLRDLLYRQLSISFRAVELPDWKGVRSLQERVLKGESFGYQADQLQAELKRRIFGVGEAETVLGLLKIDSATRGTAMQEMVVSGSDGSFYAGTVGLQTARGFIQDESYEVTFNNSVAYVRPSGRIEQQRGPKRFVHTAPINRDAIDSPDHKGMVMAPFMYPTLSESEYEHMSRTATDVVQMRVDEAVIKGSAVDLITKETIVPPRAHIRDGTITPQDRGYNHYTSRKPYGDIVREGIRLSRSILERLSNAKGSPRLYAGAVKSTQVRFFSRLVSWYIAQGSSTTLKSAIDPNWDLSQAGFISDVDVMTYLLSSLDPVPDGFWTSCVIVREFASLTDFYDRKIEGGGWFEYLKRLRADGLERQAEFGGELRYDALMSEDDLADDDYLFMLEQGDYASFYVGHTAGDPPPKIPRYEFMCSLRDLSDENAKALIIRSRHQLALALSVTGFTEDRDHNYLSRLTVVKLVASVVYQAHDFAKQLGRKLEKEFKSVVVSRLAEKRRENALGVEIRPLSVQKYLDRIQRARGELPPSGDDSV